MAKKPARLNLKPPGKCIFCGDGHLSKEHIWSQWIHQLLGTSAGTTRVEFTLVISPSERRTKLVARKERQGQVVTKKLRVVCTTCNNEWMSRIETSSESILTPLIIGKECKLDIISQKMIAIWVALKILTIEQNDLENVITDKEVRQQFKNSRKIPDGMKIWIAQCGSGGWRSALHWQVSTLGVPNEERPPRPNTQYITFGIGNRLILVLHCTAMGLDLEMQGRPEDLIFQIFPCATPVIHWPPRRVLTTLEANHLARTLDRLKSQPGVRWIK